VLGTSITTILSVNLLDMFELLLRCCTEQRVGPLKLARPVLRLFPLRAQNWLIIFVAMFTGVYYGYMYGNVARKQLAAPALEPGKAFNPWPPVQAYLSFSLPVAAAGGFLSVLVALLLPHVLVAGSGGSSASDGGGPDGGSRRPLPRGVKKSDAPADAGDPAREPMLKGRDAAPSLKGRAGGGSGVV